ncbi:PLP-dependent aminotransferase family protein [Methylotenera sp.]|uniref:MocR-like pyridoxine biosynthesis transcription factor PdxR n=1 Tax=Methylotenera sp. TaxID=2051956 RepID=UPI002731E0A0|nr:PLP-dependent aminotransferase family protein [Methylotenera sp.]MDP1522563.1 PLP-dependent aminotransferase family protein [Methylotenera sp.]MDP2070130.1 PLP-dependent aminotransferase family protein [Methylotenera sp.]MDP3006565.1 PLP-dependent aminotransferase family protein [Methylotenera sp.]MDP3307367.1 PLP-dependent aminotransferase family protein [Methylotenera sp.]
MKQLVLSEWLLTQLNQSNFPARMPNHRRIYEVIRRAITSRVLPAGARLPSTRRLAEDLTVSRNTVLAAFEQLLDEGYVASQTGSGTYVTYNQHDNFSKDIAGSNTSDNITDKVLLDSNVSNTRIKSEDSLQLSKRGLAACASTSRQNQSAKQNNSDRVNSRIHNEVQPFTPGEDDYAGFPYALWRRLLNRQWRTPNPALLDSSHDGGYLPLRKAIADYLRVSRAVNLTFDQVLITSGTQQSIDLCARLLTDHGDCAWVENPGYWAARRVLEVNGLQLHPVDVDKEGLAPTTIDYRTTPRLIYTTPSHQYPKGMVMSYGRRRLLLDYAQNVGAWIIEDDYDSEFRFEGRPISSLQGMDQNGRVLYLGTFSKVMYPGIRLGYLVVPPNLIESFKHGLYELQRPGQVVIQAALADFIEEGHFASHIRRLRQIYGERRRLLQAALASIANVGARLSTVDSGLHLVVEFDQACDDVRVTEMASEHGLRVYPLSHYCMGEKCEKGLIIGYAYAATEHITQYGGKLAEVIQEALRN